MIADPPFSCCRLWKLVLDRQSLCSFIDERSTLLVEGPDLKITADHSARAVQGITLGKPTVRTSNFTEYSRPMSLSEFEPLLPHWWWGESTSVVNLAGPSTQNARTLGVYSMMTLTSPIRHRSIHSSQKGWKRVCAIAYLDSSLYQFVCQDGRRQLLCCKRVW